MIAGDEGKPMTFGERITDAPCEPEPFIDYLLAHWRGYLEATWGGGRRDDEPCLIGSVTINIEHFIMQLKDIKQKMHRPKILKEPLAMSDLALLEACDHRFGSLMLYGRGSVHLTLEQLKSYVEEGAAPMDVTGWQPIETAPKDDTNVLLWWPFWVKNRPTIGWFGHRGIQQWVCPEACEGDGDPPTHWMPLPVPPQEHP